MQELVNSRYRTTFITEIRWSANSLSAEEKSSRLDVRESDKERRENKGNKKVDKYKNEQPKSGQRKERKNIQMLNE